MSSKGLGDGVKSLGLGALFPQVEISEEDVVKQVELDKLRPNPYQPRKHFGDDLIEELSDSIKLHGIIQPLIVRESIRGYEIIAGERRFRAAKKAGLAKVPVVVKELNDDQMLEIGLVENLQREDLNPIEIAYAYQKLMQHFSLTHEQVSTRVGKSRSHVTNFLRLLQLPEELQEDVSRGTLSMGHARALLGLKDAQQQKKLAEKVKQENASVRELEEWVQKINQLPVRKEKQKSKGELDPSLRRYEDMLQQLLSTPVKIKKGRRKGKIEIVYHSERELERLVELLYQDQVIG
ncbi:ParB/RepB/Spo0J family partition protein [Thermoflavimicrobium daqui]|uniref:Stage 0 sporulation protein J n=1 Tax=Thermoflavimicrobium daqui TaxID=2137476 RepID=A0A364K3I7_9BACL|nr:ParB/RepB/Spo0J family partition protein [Thermoflavimicrobium daqui]RAL23400.1 stage 0 sporulation protein J [Thermoflavimicrobium daqui]